MRVANWIRVSFVVGHQAPHDDYVMAHGHAYRLQAEWHMDYRPDRAPRLDRQAVTDLRAELDGTDIDKMLPGVAVLPSGIAAWALERLGCDAVEVWEGDTAARVMR